MCIGDIFRGILEAGIKRKKELEEKKEKLHPKIKEILEKKGKIWLIAAMVEGSIGYHTPSHAKRLLEDYLNGISTSGCERCICIFNWDLEEMILHDIQVFENLEKRNPEKVERVIEHCKKMLKKDEATQIQAGLVYPSMSF